MAVKTPWDVTRAGRGRRRSKKTARNPRARVNMTGGRMRTHNRTKTSENVKAVTRRVDLWLTNKLDELLEEARAIQKRPTRLPLNQKNKNKARNFADRMRQGKVASALRALNEEETGGVLPLTRDTILQLKEKHPPPSEMVGLRLQGCHQAPNSVIYEMITGDMVWKKALQTHGSAGPSGLDARGWRRLLSSTLCVVVGSVVAPSSQINGSSLLLTALMGKLG
ncbi:hypothetical protein Pcinc_033707 [Petrolisthes cinctipes]|uniref:Uncharacterized protein n=1 Tax=Petrolisthes cinctipes TaxID=88211 RepID=A0AAE1ERW1_PETCI|nr:hypothetical protein Pcinc_033707 [Petrolisthes cinctipes]